MKNKTKIMAVILVIAMVATALSGCGGNTASADVDPIVGTWEGSGMRQITMKDDGTYRYHAWDGNYYSGTWENDDGMYFFTGNASGLISHGKINDEGKLDIFRDGGGKDTIGVVIFTKN